MFFVRSLASGSSGNAFLLCHGSTRLLIDVGLPLNKLEKFLAEEDLSPRQLTAVLISHEHRDHCVGAKDLAKCYGTPLWANSAVLRAAGLADVGSARVLEVGSPTVIGDVEVTAFPVAHDAVLPVGFSLRTSRRKVTIATDLGNSTPEVNVAVGQADLVILEANHDLEMLQQGRYPHYLRARVGGPSGHLSNLQAARILTENMKNDAAEVWLAHLSKENNTAALASKTVRRAMTRAGLNGVPIGVALRDKPSLRWTGLPRPRQLSLFGGADVGERV